MSGLDWQVAPIAFTQGLDTKTNPKLVVPGKWRQLVNYTLSEDNALTRRAGISTLVGGADGNSLATHNNQLLVMAGPIASTISTAATPATAVAVSGRVGNVDIDKQEVRRSAGFQSNPDVAYGGGYTLYAWAERSVTNVSTGVNCTLVDETTGARILDNTALRTSAGVFGVRVVFADSAFFIFYIDGTSLYCRVIAISAPGTVGAEVALITSASLAGLNFDACDFQSAGAPATGGAFVAYGWADGASSVRAIIVTRAGTVPAIANGPTVVRTEAQLAIATLVGIGVARATTSTVGVFPSFITGGNIDFYASILNDSCAVTTGAGPVFPTATAAAVTPCHITAVCDGTSFYVFYDIVSAWPIAALSPLRYINMSLACAVNGSGTLINSASFAAGAGAARGPKGPFIHGKPFFTGGRVYLPVYVASVYTSTSLATSNPRTNNQQNTFFLLDCGATGTSFSAGVVVAKALYGTYGVASINGVAPPIGTPCSTPQTTTGDFATASGELTQLIVTSTAALNVSPTGLVRLTMTPNSTRGYLRGQLGESTYLSGGSLSTFDGSSIVEHGFPLFPEGIGVTVNGAGTGAVTDGVHQICVVAAWIDGAGQRHQSAPCLAVTATQATGANSGSFTVNIPTLLISQKTGVTFEAYMTQAGGITFNRVLLNNSLYAPLANITTATNVNFIIDDSDADIAGNELLYTQPNQPGATLPNIAPGPTDAIAIAHNRLWFKRSDQPGSFGYSQEYVNNLGLQFSPDLGGMLPLDAGELVGIAALDEKIILFCRRKPFVIFGTGPLPSGAFSSYSKPQEIPSNGGCIEPRSIVAMPRGIMYQSQNGILLLGRDLSVTPIGDDVLALTQGATIYAATFFEDRKECRFVTRFFNEEGPFLTLVYCYDIGQWSMFLGVAAQSYGIADAAWWHAYPSTATGSYVHVSKTEGLNFDDSTVYTDAPGGASPAGVTVVAQTAWLKVSALEGFQRIKRIYATGTNTTGIAPEEPFTLAVNFDDLDSGAPGAYTATFDAITISPTALTSVDFRHELRRMKCKSVSFTLTGTPEFGQPLTGMQAFALEVGLKRGVNKLPAAQTVT